MFIPTNYTLVTNATRICHIPGAELYNSSISSVLINGVSYIPTEADMILHLVIIWSAFMGVIVATLITIKKGMIARRRYILELSRREAEILMIDGEVGYADK
jgi:hypothetical protein